MKNEIIPSVCTRPTGVLCEDEETCDGVVSPVDTLGEPEVKESSLDLIAMTTGLSGFAEEVEEGLVLRIPPPYIKHTYSVIILKNSQFKIVSREYLYKHNHCFAVCFWTV